MGKPVSTWTRRGLRKLKLSSAVCRSRFSAALGVRPSELGATFGIVGIPLVDAQARFLKPAKFNDVADIASEVSEFRRSSFEMKHRISIGGEVAVEGSETRVWAAQDPSNPVKLKGIPIPAAVIERFRAA